ncbi:uncharacterized protein BCR38DRAFT_481174 [Pseudomassariella vexata]|uniref:Uncharacterized protein n=1 Tax=Pseudomassariella vexata TaxID=1141098 RepID=A0A1Y2EEM5_9PEZI|nr:uncharacterized protein BCR38DRAFT_481174 [Pseudomassariella vexata]ORY70022.1 hypothetical protein BCR38DRAFT_481174 [Pseudomassariella vexata]
MPRNAHVTYRVGVWPFNQTQGGPDRDCALTWWNTTGYAMFQNPGQRYSQAAIDQNRLGSCAATLIHGAGDLYNNTSPWIDFWDDMARMPYQRTEDVALELFDRHGDLKDEFCMGATTVWRDKFGDRFILVIDHLRILDHLPRVPQRTADLKESLMRELLAKAQAQVDEIDGPKEFFAIASGAMLKRELSIHGRDLPEDEQRMPLWNMWTQHNFRFLRKMGFRRLGSSHYLAWSSDENHPSRQITLEDEAALDQIILQGAPVNGGLGDDLDENPLDLSNSPEANGTHDIDGSQDAISPQESTASQDAASSPDTEVSPETTASQNAL